MWQLLRRYACRAFATGVKLATFLGGLTRGLEVETGAKRFLGFSNSSAIQFHSSAIVLAFGQEAPKRDLLFDFRINNVLARSTV